MDISIKNTENSHDDANLLMKAPSQIYGQLAGLETQKKNTSTCIGNSTTVGV